MNFIIKTKNSIIVTDLKKFKKVNIPKNQNINTVNSEKNKKFSKKIKLRGLGYKITALSDKNVKIKLSNSHENKLEISEPTIYSSVKKNLILLQSTDKILLGNLAKKVYLLKPCDKYKGKGFHFANKQIRLKAIKKK